MQNARSSCPPPRALSLLRLWFATSVLRFVVLQLREQEQEAEGASRQDAARLGAMNTKLTKDYNRVNAIALDLATQVRFFLFFFISLFLVTLLLIRRITTACTVFSVSGWNNASYLAQTMGASYYFCKRLGERKTGMLGSVAAFEGCLHAFGGNGRWLLELLLIRTICGMS